MKKPACEINLFAPKKAVGVVDRMCRLVVVLIAKTTTVLQRSTAHHFRAKACWSGFWGASVATIA